MSLLERLEAALGDGEVELSARWSRQGTTRFANSRVTQTSDVEDVIVQARVALGRRVGAARTNRLEGIAETIARARELAAAQPEAPAASSFGGFDDGKLATPAAANSFHEEVVAADAARRATLVAPAFARAAKAGLTAAGLALTGVSETAVATTAGCRRTWPSTICRLDVILGDARLGRCSTQFIGDADVIAERVCERAARAKDPIELAPGKYDVVLEPPAVAEMLEWLAITSLGARNVEDGSSCLAGREGERIAGNATVTDDGLSGDEGCPTLPFDSEGTPRQKVTFLDGGIARGPVHDRASAQRNNARSTGHATPLGEELFEGQPAPLHLQLAGGSDTRDTLLARVDRGLYVARFHYVNGLLDTRRALMTGMTRDGLFLVENGAIKNPVRNLRWTESLLEALGRCDGMSQARELVASGLSDSYAVTPAMLVRNWTFTR